jgi:hypothetical protein
MLWQNASARTVPTASPFESRSQCRSSSDRIVVAPSRFLQKAAKSCSPRRFREALFIESRSSGRDQESTCPRLSGSTTSGRSAIR